MRARSVKPAHHLPYTVTPLALRTMFICAPRQAWGPHARRANSIPQIGPWEWTSGLQPDTPVSTEWAPLPLIWSDGLAASPEPGSHPSAHRSS